MPSMKAIKRRITSVKNTGKIMKAMNLVAASKVQKNRAKLEAIRPMFTDAKRFVNEGINDLDAMDSLYYGTREGKRSAYVVICGERGLCGGYNTNILKEALNHITKEDTEERVVAVGAKCREYFVRRGKEVVAEYKGIMDHVSYAEAAKISQRLVEMYNHEDPDQRVDAIYIAYTQFETLLSHTPKLVKLLPFGGNAEESGEGGENGEDEKKKSTAEIIYEPDVATYLDKAVPVYLTMFIYGAMTEAAVCEQASRMTSMDAAARNAGEIVDDLTLLYNRQRQGAITQEISEIVGGANAI
ncbi:MAG: ATP synthase F1 subunit gamma [Turicibacter sp.]|nr:ATP synthase F1 subunit gamma [Turicibacter sp.]